MKIYTLINNRPRFVLPIALLALLIPVALIEYQVTRHTGGTLMYPLDDTFIHLTIAKNLALHGTWGITGGEFQSASSSLLYTFLLAALIRIFGAHVWIPLFVNIISGIILIIMLTKRLRKENLGPFGQLIILLAVIFFTPVPILVISGMEHTLQCLFTFLFIFRFSDWLEKTDNEAGKNNLPIPLFLYGVLCCTIRYEGLFLIAIACLLLLYKRRIRAAFLLGFVCLLPVVLFGLYSISKGSYFLPNSVLIKSETATLSFAGIFHFVFNIILRRLTGVSEIFAGITAIATRYLLIILPLFYLYFEDPIKKAARYGYVLILLIFCTFLQLALASTGWFYRYEAYLFMNSVLIVSVMLCKFGSGVLSGFRRQPLVTGFIFSGLLLPAGLRCGDAFIQATGACVNIYDQQFQMARFLKTYYDDQTVAANDIGAIAYYKNKRPLDLFGLASIKVARSIKNNYNSPAFLDSLSKSEQVGIAALYERWFSDSLLVRWDKVATWTIPNNVICADSVVTFYALDKANIPELRKNLKEYQPVLPAGVRVKYY
jgi:hypothetical protein